MTTSALNVGNLSFPSFRGAMNTALQANGSQQYNATEPSTIYPLQRWADATTHTLKQRDEANSAWHVVGSLDEDTIITKSSAYTLQLRDFGKTILLSAGSAFTLSLLPAATAKAGFVIFFKKIDSSANAITVDGDGTELVGLTTTVELYQQGQTLGLMCDGSGWQIVAFPVTGKQTISIPAGAMTPRKTNGCGSKGTITGATDQTDVDYLPFDGAVKEYARLPGIWMPKGWNLGTVTAKFSWRRESGTGAANVVWGIRAVALSSSDSPATNFGTGATVTSAADTTTADLVLSAATGNCTIGNTPAAEDLVFFEVYRDGASGSDTLDGVDAWLVAVKITYSTLAPTDA